MDWVLFNTVHMVTGLYMAMTVAMLFNFKLVGYHNAVYATFMAVVLLTHITKMMDLHTTMHILVIGVAIHTVYNMKERLKHIR